MLDNEESWKTFIPTILVWISNQYHFWLFGNGKDRHGVIRGDFGFSYMDSQPISEKIWSRVWISFTFTIISVLLAYLISIPLGIYSAYRKDSILIEYLLLLYLFYTLCLVSLLEYCCYIHLQIQIC